MRLVGGARARWAAVLLTASTAAFAASSVPLAIAVVAAPPDQLVAWKAKGGLWGYLRADGRWAIPPRFSAAKAFGPDGLAEVAQRARGERARDPRGFIDRSGAWVLEPRWNDVKHPCGSSFPVKSQGLWRLVDSAGQPLSELSLKDIGDFSEGLAVAWSGGSFGYVSPEGRWAIKPRFSGGGDFVGGLAPAKLKGKWGFIDAKGDFVIEPRYELAGPFSPSGLARAKLGGRWILLGRDGNPRAWLDCDEACDSSGGLWPVRLGNLWGFADDRGSIVVAPRFKKRSAFGSGLARERDETSGLWGYIGMDGGWAIEPRFGRADDFEAGFARARIGDGGRPWVLISATGRVLVIPELQDIDQ